MAGLQIVILSVLNMEITKLTQLAPLERIKHYKGPEEVRAGKNDRCSMRLLDFDIVLIPTLKS
jgi:hypothetical protein